MLFETFGPYAVRVRVIFVHCPSKAGMWASLALSLLFSSQALANAVPPSTFSFNESQDLDMSHVITPSSTRIANVKYI